MTHIVAGYPSLEESEEIARALIDSGFEYLEIQIPFSDPIADGPTIADANQVALRNGVTVGDCFDLMQRLSTYGNTHILFMTYFNIPFRYGLKNFCKKAKECGAYGLIIPDIPLDEEPYEQYVEIAQEHDLHPIQVISPLTTNERLSEMADVVSGFVYCTARTGITGIATQTDADFVSYMKRVSERITIPIAVGFGICERAHVLALEELADIAVVGSALIREYQKERSSSAVAAFVESLR